MLIRFSVENYLCFGPPLCLDLRPPLPTPGSASTDMDDGATVSRPARIALIAGGSGAGKSAFLRALSLLRNLSLAGPRPPLPVLSNRFYPPGPTRIAIEVQSEAALFRYALSLTPQEISAESLHMAPLNTATGRPSPDERLIFLRSGSAPGRPPLIELGDLPSSESGRLRVVAQNTRPEQPLLNEGLRRGLPLFVPLGMWLRDRLQLLLPEPKLVGLAARGARDAGFLDFLSEYLAVADLGIKALGIERKSLPPGYFQSEEEQEEVTAQLTRFADSFAETEEGELIAQPAASGPFVDIERVRLAQTIGGENGRQAELAADELPSTARRLLHLSPLFYAAPTGLAPPACAVIDDFAQSLSPRLLSSLLGRFAQDADLPAERQLIGFLPDFSGDGDAEPTLAARLFDGLRKTAPDVAAQLWWLKRTSAGSQLTVVV